MKAGEIRHRLIQALLQSENPLTADDVAGECGITQDAVLPVLEGLVKEGLVTAGLLVRDDDTVYYRWGARWQAEVSERAGSSQDQAREAVDSADPVPVDKLWLDSPPVIAFHRYVIERYEPPREKRFLVFFQCSVRRPFSKSPSHGSMRRAIAVATGFDPAKEFQKCPVHVVVLASKIGPVPYELEDVYPANVRSGGVKHFDERTYRAARPVLAERMAEYVDAHGRRYDAMWTFTDGRYAEVMADAARSSASPLVVLPDPTGPSMVRMGESVPRTYWQKYWIQLYLKIVASLDADARVSAKERLKKLRVEYG